MNKIILILSTLCVMLLRDMQTKLPLPNGLPSIVQEEILRGSCKSVYLYFYSNSCFLPGINSSMKLQVKVVQQFSTQKCTEGISYGLAQDNPYIWVAGLCYAEFAIYSVYNITTTAAPTTTTAATTTTKAVVTASTAATTNTSQSVNDICGKATTCEYPWMAVLVNMVNQSVCGGAIIDSTHILTAAHSVVSTNYTTKSQVISPAVNLLVYTGSSTLGFLPNSNATRRYVVKVTPHEQYNDTTYDTDIAILTLSAPISFTTCQSPLCIVNATSSPQNSTQCRVMGCYKLLEDVAVMKMNFLSSDLDFFPDYCGDIGRKNRGVPIKTFV
ncbi:Serine protease 48 [Bulinus truncatus]|nr:Serine protease 48 [Bulinus truncatus]